MFKLAIRLLNSHPDLTSGPISFQFFLRNYIWDGDFFRIIKYHTINAKFKGVRIIKKLFSKTQPLVYSNKYNNF